MRKKYANANAAGGGARKARKTARYLNATLAYLSKTHARAAEQFGHCIAWLIPSRPSIWPLVLLLGLYFRQQILALSFSLDSSSFLIRMTHLPMWGLMGVGECGVGVGSWKWTGDAGTVVGSC